MMSSEKKNVIDNLLLKNTIYLKKHTERELKKSDIVQMWIKS